MTLKENDCRNRPERSSILSFFKDLRFTSEYYKDFTLKAICNIDLKEATNRTPDFTSGEDQWKLNQLKDSTGPQLLTSKQKNTAEVREV